MQGLPHIFADIIGTFSDNKNVVVTRTGNNTAAVSISRPLDIAGDVADWILQSAMWQARACFRACKVDRSFYAVTITIPEELL